jgi:dephospho-CoA kinase
MKKIIEVTGVAGVGKSFVIDRLMLQNSNIILDSDVIKRYKLSDLYLFYLFFKTKRSFSNFLNILKISLFLNMGVFDRLNFIRNSIKKIGKDYFLEHIFNENKIVLVDEGISHLYQNIISPNRQNDRYLTRLVDKIISNLNFSRDIIVVDAPFEVVYERLKQRGHKRVLLKDLKPFIKKSKEQIFRLKRRFPKITEIENGV